MNILAIGAHPDDIEIGCGGLLLKAVKNGHNVFMYVLTRGKASGDPGIRTQELVNSARIIQADKLWIDNFEDTRLELNIDLIRHIEFFVNKSQADVIYTHSIKDTHHDHRAVGSSTIEAGRYVPNILAYEMPVTKDFSPQVYYDISDVLDDKIRLINVFHSQSGKLFIKSNAIKGLAKYRALQSRQDTLITAVEAFEVIKIGFKEDFKLFTMNKQDLFASDKEDIYDNIIEYPTIDFPVQPSRIVD